MSSCSHPSEGGGLTGNQGMFAGQSQVSVALDRRAGYEFKWVDTCQTTAAVT